LMPNEFTEFVSSASAKVGCLSLSRTCVPTH